MSDTKTAQQALMLTNRLAKKFKHLSKWAGRTGAGVFRLYDRDIPEIPLVLDYYTDENSLSSVSGALYKRPYEKDETEEKLWLDEMRKAAAAALDIQCENVFLKLRQRQYGKNQYEKFNNRSVTRTIRENGMRFKVNLSDYLDTGIFPDRRLLHRQIMENSAGKRVLNLFCYTGTFSVAAAAGGAVSTCSVDLSNTYLAWAQENFYLNKLKVRLCDAASFWFMSKYKANVLVRSDVLAFLKEARSKRCAWDTIILDPPSFSNSKKMDAVLDLKRDSAMLIGQCLALLSGGGELWLSINAKNFSVNLSDLTDKLKQNYPGLKISDYTRKMTDEDFRGRKTPQTFLIKV